MDSFELNKIIGAILGTLLFVMGVGFLAEGIYAPITNHGPSYDLPEPAAASTKPVAAVAAIPLPELLAKADPVAGEASAKKRLRPVSVPADPTPHTTASTSPSS